MFCLSIANGCFKVIVSKTRTVAEWWAKLFSPSYRQWRELFCHFVTKPNLSDCIIFLFFLEICTVYCLKISLSLKKRMFPKKVTRTLQWKVCYMCNWFTTVILIFFYCSSLVAIWPQCHALHEKPLFERWFICVCVFFSFFFSQIEFFNQNDDVLPFSQFPPERFLYLNVGLISLDVWLVDKIYFFFLFFWVVLLLSFEQSLTDSWYDFRQTLVVNEDQQCQKTGTEVNTHFDAFLFVFCGLVWFIDVLVIIVV